MRATSSRSVVVITGGASGIGSVAPDVSQRPLDAGVQLWDDHRPAVLGVHDQIAEAHRKR